MHRRRHLVTLLSLLIVAGAAVRANRSAPEPVTGLDPATMPIELRAGAYFPEGFPLHGKVRLLSAPVAEMGKRTRVQVEYTVGDMAIEEGMSIQVWKHFTSDVEEFQVGYASEPAFFGVESTAAGLEIETSIFPNNTRRNDPSVFPYRQTAAMTVRRGRIGAGEKILLDLGGKRGVRMQHYEESLFNFRLVIVQDKKVLGYAGDVLLKVTGGPFHKLKVQAPSIVAVGERFAVEVVPQDRWGSLAKNAASVKLVMASEDTSGAAFQYEASLLHFVARDVVLMKEGIHRIRVRADGGSVSAVSNPIRVERHPLRRVFYGDLHQHTYLADGRGVFEELYLYARRVGMLDFGALTPHHRWLTGDGPSYHLEGVTRPSDNWPALSKANRVMNGWQGFVPILGYEYSVGTKSGGHHNVFYNADEAPTTMHLDPNNPLAPIGEMLKTLDRARRPTLVIPHVGGGPPDWEHPTDPKIERLYEIASVHGVFEESYQKHLQAGLRLAASAAGDTHTTSFGNAYPGLIYTMTNALTGVYAYSKTRDDIWDGLYQKRTFAVTGNIRMLLDFRVNGEPMGGELARTSGPRRLEVRVSGTAPLLRIDLLKNSEVIHSVFPSRNHGRILRLSWGDNIYQRRAAVSLVNGELRAASGSLRLVSALQTDQAVEWFRQRGPHVAWRASTSSNDRDPILVDIAEASGGALRFRADDVRGLGLLETEIPLDRLRREGRFVWKSRGTRPYEHSYLKKMGIPVQFTLECDLVNAEGPMDYELTYEDREPAQSGDYYYLRVEQLDGNLGWSSPVWLN